MARFRRRGHVSAFASVALLAAALPGQTAKNVDLLAQLDPASPGEDYSDIWGYRDPVTGGEYALLCSEEGLHVIDCTDPLNPVQRGMIPTEVRFSSGNAWRDVKTYGTYAYVVSEAYGGMQIIDLSDPDDPTKLSVWGGGLWSDAHNIAIDVGAGYAYVCGTGAGTRIIDLSNPTSPSLAFTLSSPYIHDLTVARGFGYLCDQNGNNLLIYRSTLLPAEFIRLSSAPLPGASIAHASWPSDDDDYCLVTNESSGGPLSIWDVRDKRLPQLASTYRANPGTAPSAIPHNCYMHDRIAHVSYYSEGYRVLDLSDPSDPVEVGWYDTYSGPSGGYDGAWGCYHEQPSGVIYVSDIQQGLWVFKPKATPVRYGEGAAGSQGATPTIHTFGAAWLGNDRFRLEARAAPASAPGVLLLGVGRASLPFGGIEIAVSLAPTLFAFSVSSDAQGDAGVPLPMPTSQAFSGGVLNAQFVFADSLTTLDLSATQGLEFELFER